MPRNGSGVYSPTAGVPVVSGTTISSTMFNTIIDDLGDEITASMPVAGTAPMTGVLRVTLGSVSAPGLAFVGDTDTGIYSPGANQLALATNGTVAVTVSSTQATTWTAKATGKAFDVDAITDVASASTTDIGAAATSEVRITGTTTITSFGTSNAGIRRRGRFADALTLTHNGTSLILPGGVSITTAANDRFEALSLGSGNWIVTNYVRASGLPIVNPTAVTGTVAQRVQTRTTSALTGSTTIPLDDTIPQNTEGDEYITRSITPTNASSTLRIDVELNAANSTGAGHIIAALFQDSTANALEARAQYTTNSGVISQIVFTYWMTAGTTSSTTFKLRAGFSTAATLTVNGAGGVRQFGGTLASSITITEILP